MTATEDVVVLAPQESAIVPGAFANPLDPIIYPDEVQQDALSAAGEARVEQCMAERGFDYGGREVFAYAQRPVEAADVYGAVDADRALQNGMRSQGWMESVRAEQRDGPLQVERPAGFDEALFGDPGRREVVDETGAVIATYDPDSCAGSALDAVTPDWALQRHLSEIGYLILLDAELVARADPDVAEAQTRWSDCMSARGFVYETSVDAADDPAFAEQRLPTAEEIRTAVAAADCTQSSGLLRADSGARARYTQERLDEYPGLVTEWLGLQQDAFERAVS